jgi:hypothetical protein
MRSEPFGRNERIVGGGRHGYLSPFSIVVAGQGSKTRVFAQDVPAVNF